MVEELEDATVVMVGCGKMGEALARGALSGGALEARRLYLVDAVEARAESLADDVGAEVGYPPGVQGPRIVVVAVKPSDVRGALAGARDAYGGALGAADTVISIAAGVPLVLLRRWAGPEPSLVRAMPNTPALVGAGITGIKGERSDQPLGAAEALFGAVGSVVRLEYEEHFDALTAISGSGPAYLFGAMEALADGGVAAGLDRETAVELAAATVGGAAALAREGSAHTAELKDRVASPGGTTIAGLVELEERGFRAALIAAVRRAAGRSRELGEALLREHGVAEGEE
jgi:pyrroline-5-carboxylate reductase